MNESTTELRGYDPAFVFRTKEQIEAVEGKSLAPYLRPHDPFCATVLKTGETEAEADLVQKVYPFFRLAAALQLPPSKATFGCFLANGFFAGFVYGTQFPNQAEEITVRAFGGNGFAHQRVFVLNGLLQGKPTQLQSCWDAFQIIADSYQIEPGRAFQNHLIQTTLKSIVVGFDAATTGKTDPALAEFIEQLAVQINAAKMPLVPAVLTNSLCAAEGRPVVDLLRHPMLTLAEAHYPATPIERETLLAFFHYQLGRFGVRSERECPVWHFDLVAWLQAGLDYGATVLRNRPELVATIYSELPPGKLPALKELAISLRAEANGMEPCSLLGAILRRHEKTEGWWNPSFYAHAMTRAVFVADWAVWLPWLLI